MTDSPSFPHKPELARRRLLTLGVFALAGGVIEACSSTGDDTAAAGGSAGSGGGTAAGTGGSAGTATASEGGAAGSTATTSGWATGGTAAMTDKANYPNPFTDLPATCTASCELTEGPCYSSQSVEIRDISYGYDGLPMRLYLRILDEDCNPVSGATVDVWHAGPTGIYSGNDATNENVAFCTGNDADFTSHLYFRGKQTTDANGVVYFDSCFPGWYSSRTIHIHMTISVGTDAYLTTQFGFADTLDDAIVESQPLYKDRGERDTTNSTDTVLPATDVEEYLFDTKQLDDGAMLAWKTVILRKALSETLCSPAGANSNGGGMAGDGGPGMGMSGAPGMPPG